jgi:hypothetical protein
MLLLLETWTLMPLRGRAHEAKGGLPTALVDALPRGAPNPGGRAGAVGAALADEYSSNPGGTFA